MIRISKKKKKITAMTKISAFFLEFHFSFHFHYHYHIHAPQHARAHVIDEEDARFFECEIKMADRLSLSNANSVAYQPATSYFSLAPTSPAAPFPLPYGLKEYTRMYIYITYLLLYILSILIELDCS